MAETFDPIGNIKRFSPTAHLQKGAADTGSALQRLMSGRLIQSDKDIAAGQRQTGVNLNNMRMEGLRQNLADIAETGKFSPNTRSALNLSRTIGDAERAGKTADFYASAGIRPIDTKTSFTASQFPALQLKAGFPFKGEASAFATSQAEAKRGSRVKRKRVEYVNGAFEQVEREEFVEEKGKVKGGAVTDQRARAIIESAKRIFDKRGMPFRNAKVVSENDKEAVLVIDGKEITIPFAAKK